MRHGICVLNRKAFQFYVVVLVGLFCYLHYCRYGGRDATDAIGTADESSVKDLFSHLSDRRLRETGNLQHQQNYVAPRPPPHRFIFSLNYWEQFTMATVNLLSLVCLGNKWNATTVQPYTFNSRLYGLRNFKPDDNYKKSNQLAHSLDLIYDISSLNNLLSKYKLPKLATFESFLHRGSREVIVVHYISPKETHELIVMKGEVKNKIEEGFRVQPVVDCNNHLSSYHNAIENALNDQLISYQSLTAPQIQDKFHISKYWCVNMSAFSTPQESALRMEFGSGNATIVVVNWRGLGKGKFVKNSVRGFHLNNRIAMFNACRHHLSSSGRNVIGYSSLVEQMAKRFAASLGLAPGDKFAAVHIRSEKLGLREPRMPGVTAACFNELMRLKRRIAQENPSLRFIYVTDYGPYSSDTCKKCRGSKDIKQFFHDRGIHITYFNPAHFNVTVDSGFAAAVESHFLASASFLFLCGGGGYQNQIGARFEDLKYRTQANDKDIFRVCNEDSEIHRLLKVHKENLTSGT